MKTTNKILCLLLFSTLYSCGGGGNGGGSGSQGPSQDTTTPGGLGVNDGRIGIPKISQENLSYGVVKLEKNPVLQDSFIENKPNQDAFLGNYLGEGAMAAGLISYHQEKRHRKLMRLENINLKLTNKGEIEGRAVLEYFKGARGKNSFIIRESEYKSCNIIYSDENEVDALVPAATTKEVPIAGSRSSGSSSGGNSSSGNSSSGNSSSGSSSTQDTKPKTKKVTTPSFCYVSIIPVRNFVTYQQINDSQGDTNNIVNPFRSGATIKYSSSLIIQSSDIERFYHKQSADTTIPYEISLNTITRDNYSTRGEIEKYRLNYNSSVSGKTAVYTSHWNLYNNIYFSIVRVSNSGSQDIPTRDIKGTPYAINQSINQSPRILASTVDWEQNNLTPAQNVFFHKLLAQETMEMSYGPTFTYPISNFRPYGGIVAPNEVFNNSCSLKGKILKPGEDCLIFFLFELQPEVDQRVTFLPVVDFKLNQNDVFVKANFYKSGDIKANPVSLSSSLSGEDRTLSSNPSGIDRNKVRVDIACLFCDQSNSNYPMNFPVNANELSLSWSELEAYNGLVPALFEQYSGLLGGVEEHQIERSFKVSLNYLDSDLNTIISKKTSVNTNPGLSSSKRADLDNSMFLHQYISTDIQTPKYAALRLILPDVASRGNIKYLLVRPDSSAKTIFDGSSNTHLENPSSFQSLLKFNRSFLIEVH